MYWGAFRRTRAPFLSGLLILCTHGFARFVCTGSANPGHPIILSAMSAKSVLHINGFAIQKYGRGIPDLIPKPCKTFFDRSPDLLQKGEAGFRNNNKYRDNDKPETLSRDQGHEDRIRDPVHLPLVCRREYNREQDAQGPFPECPGDLLPALQGTPHRADTRQGPLAGDIVH